MTLAQRILKPAKGQRFWDGHGVAKRLPTAVLIDVSGFWDMVNRAACDHASWWHHGIDPVELTWFEWAEDWALLVEGTPDGVDLTYVGYDGGRLMSMNRHVIPYDAASDHPDWLAARAIFWIWGGLKLAAAE